MEKVKVTQEQADVLFEIAKMVKDIPAKKVIRALEEGFEVEPEFEVGDWVVYKHDNTIWEIIGELYGGKVHYNITRDGKHKGSVHKDHIRLATPEEIAAEKERRKIEKFKNLKPGTLLILKGKVYEFVAYDETHPFPIRVRRYKDGEYDGLNHKGVKILCFPEDRKDVENA